MEQIVYIGLREKSLELLKGGEQGKETSFLQVSGSTFRETCKALSGFQALVIGEEVENPIRLAQEAYTQDKTISILLLNDAQNHQKIKQALQFSPFIGPTVQCISNEAGPRMAPVLEDAMQRTAQRRSFAKLKSTSLADRQFSPNVFEKVRTDFTTKVLQEAPIGAVLISGNGTINSINNYALGLFDKSEKEVLGTPIASLFPVAVRAEAGAFLQDGYLSEEKKVFEVQERGKTQYLEISVAPIDLKAASTYKLVILNNITATVVAQRHTQAHLEELEKLNANLARVNADLDTFVYTASHDLKSPILNIEGLVASLETELGPARTAVELELEHIKRSVKRFKQTVEDLTEISRIQRSFEHEASCIKIAELIEDVQQMLELEFKETDAVITLDSESAPFVFFPRRNLFSILINLVGNAIKYRSPSRAPHIQIRTWREHDYYCISVQDNGLGIPETKRDRVFQLFKRMHSHVQGSGVGLFIVKRIVENNGGKVSIESEEGLGATFRVQLKEYAFKPN